MPTEKNHNAESDLRGSLIQEQNLAQKKLLVDQLQQLRALEKSLSAQKKEKSDDNQISVVLDKLEQRVNNLNDQHTDLFVQEVQRIQEQMDHIKKIHGEIAEFRKGISIDQNMYSENIASRLPDHNPEANQKRAESALEIATIKPEDGGNVIANRAASRIQKILS